MIDTGRPFLVQIMSCSDTFMTCSYEISSIYPYFFISPLFWKGVHDLFGVSVSLQYFLSLSLSTGMTIGHSILDIPKCLVEVSLYAHVIKYMS